MPQELSNRVALISGASRGIGRQIALTLSEHGANIAICARNEKKLVAVQREVEERGGNCFAQVCDVKSEGAVKAFVARCLDKFGKVDILVNNAGIYLTQPVLGHSLQDFQDVMETNLTGSFLLAREVLASMKDELWGRVVNISSVSGKVGEKFGAAYSASKFALIGLTQALAQETAEFGITVNAVCPGWVETEMAENQLHDPKWLDLNKIKAEESLEIAMLAVPQRRFVTGEEVAALVLFLSSERSSAITGQAINICGGLCLH